MKTKTIRLKKSDNMTIPTYGTEMSSGFDITSIEDVYLKPNAPTLVHTGLYVAIPEGTELQIRPRSGMVLKDGITVANSPGTLDADYRGELGVILIWSGYNDEDTGKFSVSYYSTGKNFEIRNKEKIIPAGTRIAQGVLAPYIKAQFELVDDLNSTDRGEGGFGHTGV